ncbi:MAG: hypothetical protein HC788_05040 [Sphingopyxis sp.]|nr:hypothetical protein [Sphingopyxis sp.]
MPEDAQRLFEQVDRMDRILADRRADSADEALALAVSGKTEMRRMPAVQRAMSAAANAMTRRR